jgi:multiple sugar transport system substrate-binding protein
LLGATLGELPVPKALNALAGGELDAAGAAKRAADDVRAIKTSLK